jgi:hypothetical protein
MNRFLAKHTGGLYHITAVWSIITNKIEEIDKPIISFQRSRIIQNTQILAIFFRPSLAVGVFIHELAGFINSVN